ncbi:hypothetical protein NESM_000368300 [Novymonas esmeraldas]|uniref:t-SNARE coiled-coil homology domain-containing protein n=1 Tax=Novymonas esmeraldas TaxID=1808958 RepID=A0AAW0EM53_9TRYP
MLSGSSSPPPPPLPLHEDEVAVTRSPYQEAELHAIALMRSVREHMTVVDRLTAQDSPAKRLELHNSIRKCEAELRVALQEASRHAVMERRADSFCKLQAQGTTTQQLIRAHYGTLAGLGGVGGANHFSLADAEDTTEPVGATDQARDDGDGRAPHYDIAQDHEFHVFFEETQRNDARVDAALDRIEFGVQRIHENAHGIHDELDAQESVLRRAGKKADSNEAAMSGMSRRLQRTIRKLGKSRLITYAVLCVVLLVLIVVIIILGKSL